MLFCSKDYLNNFHNLFIRASAFEQNSLDINSNEFEEIFNEKILRDLTRAYVDLLEPIFGSGASSKLIS